MAQPLSPLARSIHFMGEFMNRAMGKTKKSIGRATGNRRLQARGALQEGKGRLQTGARRTKNRVERGARKVGRKVRSATRPKPIRRAGSRGSVSRRRATPRTTGRYGY